MSPALIAAGVQGVVGLGQMLFSGKNKAIKQLEAQTNASPTASRSKSISDYYNTSLSRFQENPYQSQQYQTAVKGAQAGTATGLGALQDRRSGIAGVSRMVGIQNQALDTARVNAENQRNQRFGQLGGATQMQSAEDRRLFQQNVLSPYERRLQLANMKAQGATNVFNAGMSNLAGAGSTAAMMNMRKSDTMGADSYRKNLPDMKVGSLPTEMANYAAQQSTADMPSGIANTFPNEIRNTLLLHPSFRTKSY